MSILMKLKSQHGKPEAQHFQHTILLCIIFTILLLVNSVKAQPELLSTFSALIEADHNSTEMIREYCTPEKRTYFLSLGYTVQEVDFICLYPTYSMLKGLCYVGLWFSGIAVVVMAITAFITLWYLGVINPLGIRTIEILEAQSFTQNIQDPYRTVLDMASFYGAYRLIVDFFSTHIRRLYNWWNDIHNPPIPRTITTSNSDDTINRNTMLEAQSLLNITLEPIYVDLACDILMFYRSISRDRSTENWFINILNVVRIYYPPDKIYDVVAVILSEQGFKLEAQSSPTLGKLRSFVDTWKNLNDSELSNKFHSTMHGLVSCGIIAKLGYTFSSDGYRSLFGRGIPQTKSTSVQGLAYTITEFTVTLLESGYECFVDNSLKPLLIKDRRVRQWLDNYTKFLDQILSLPHNIHSDPQDLIMQIRKTLANGADLMTHEKAMVPMWRDLSKKYETLQKEYGISAVRKPPFSVLVHGPIGIGKSNVVGLLGSIYANTVNREGYYDIKYDPNKSVYTYSSVEDYMSGYKGDSQWCFVMDDLGKEHVNHVKQGKCIALNDIITIINTVGIASNQAALEDKGRIPINPKTVIATTNCKHLNAYFGLAEPSAALRRFPYILCPVLKPEFVDPESGLMKKLDYIEHDPLLYRIECIRFSSARGKTISHYDVFIPELNKVLPVEDVGDHRVLCTVQEMTQFMVEKIIKHEKNVEVMSEAATLMKEATLCVHNVTSLHNCIQCDPPPIGPQLPTSTPIGPLLESQSYFTFPKNKRAVKFYAKLYRGFTKYAPDSLQESVIDYFLLDEPKSFVAVLQENCDFRVPWKVLMLREAAGVAAGIAGCYALYKALSFMFIPSDNSATGISESDDSHNQPVAQTDIWARSESHQTFFKVPPTSKVDNELEIVNTISKSIFRLAVTSDGKTQNVCAITLKEGVYLTTAHAFSTADKWLCVADYGCSQAHVSSSAGVTITSLNLHRLDNDLMIFTSGSLLPRKPLYKFLPQIIDTVGRKCLSITMLPGGAIEVGSVQTTGISRINYNHETGPIVGDFLNGERLDRKPMLGDCGSVIVAYSKVGYFICGIQCAGSPRNSTQNRLITTPLSKELCDSVEITNDLLALSSPTSYHDILTNGNNGPLKEPHYKGIHHWIDVGSNALILGSFDKRSTHSSKTTPSLICSEVEQKFGMENMLVAPLMTPEQNNKGEWLNPFTIAANLMAKPTPHYDDAILTTCLNAYYTDTTIQSKWLSTCRTATEQEAINGVHGDSYIHGLPMSTSGGFDFPGCKRQYFHFIDPYYVPLPLLQDSIDRIEANYALGNRCNIVFQGSLKDEPIKMKKRLLGETRIFTACPVSFSIVVRKQFMFLTDCIRQNNFITECAVGMNCYSEIWQDLYTYLCTFGKNKIIAGDHKSYDKRMPSNVIRACFQVLIKWRELAGNFSSYDRQMCIGIATDISFPIVNMNGDLFQFFGSNPSGQPLTVIINSLANSIYMRVAYYDLIGNVHTFRKNVRLMTLGDDNIMGSNEPKYNHTAIVEAFRLRGLKYTMADKEATSVPFINISDAEFLKRSFVRNEIRFVAPLAMASIFKSLNMTVHHGNISEEETISQAYLAARREICLHGESKFISFVSKMEEIFNHHPSITRFFINKHKYDYTSTLDWTLGLVELEEDSLYLESGVHGSDNLE